MTSEHPAIAHFRSDLEHALEVKRDRLGAVGGRLRVSAGERANPPPGRFPQTR